MSWICLPDLDTLLPPLIKISATLYPKMKNLIANAAWALTLALTAPSMVVQLLLIPTTTYAQQGLNPDPTERWKTWQSAGEATVRTPQLRDGRVYQLMPAEIVYYSALENNVNPVLLLVKLQHEQGMLATSSTDAAALQRRLDRAAGFGIFDSDPDHTKWAGFYPQLVAASYQFGSLWRRTFRSSAEAIARYSSDPKAGEKVAAIYADYAARMNRIAGKSYATAPGGWGHVDDFRDVSSTQIQSFLDQFPGNLKNRSLFGGSSTPMTGPKVNNQPAIPAEIAKDQRLTFTVTTDQPADQVKITFQNPDGEATLVGSGKLWSFDRPITVAGSRPWVISVVQGGKLSDNHVRGILTVTGVNPAPVPVPAPPAAVVMPLAPMPDVTQSLGNKLNYKTSACHFVGYHTGVDYAPVAVGQAVSSIAEGTVLKTGQIGATPSSLGSYVVVDHPQLGVRSYYLHVVPALTVGARVRAGQKVASIAATTAVGKHLHLEIQKATFGIQDSNGRTKLFVGHSTTPIGSCGYLTREADLTKGWLNPAEFLKHPVAQAGASQHQAGHEDVEIEELPPLADQKKRLDVVTMLLAGLARSGQTFSGNVDQQALAGGLIAAPPVQRPQESASRMEVALLAHRALVKFAPGALAVKAAGAPVFSIDEFSDTPDVTSQQYLAVVNALASAGIVNGSRDANGEQRFYPTRKASSSEVQVLVDRTLAKLTTIQPTLGARILEVPAIAASIEQNSSLSFTVTTDKPADRVLMVLQNPDGSAQLTGSGTRFTFDRPITVSGTRPWKLQVFSGNQLTDEHVRGVLEVRPAGGAVTPIQVNWDRMAVTWDGKSPLQLVATVVGDHRLVSYQLRKSGQSTILASEGMARMGNGSPKWATAPAFVAKVDSQPDGEFEVYASVLKADNQQVLSAPAKLLIQRGLTAPDASPLITAVQAQGPLVVNSVTTLVFQGRGLTADVRVTLSDCDLPQTQLVSASEIRYQCTPRIAGPQQAGWKASPSEVNARPLTRLNVAAAAPIPPVVPMTCPSGDGRYCGDGQWGRTTSSLFMCQAGIYSVLKTCTAGCVKAPAGSDDYCASDGSVLPQSQIAKALFKGKATNHDYNNWGDCPPRFCSSGRAGYIGGHSGIDIQTQSKGADTFYSLSPGVVTAAATNAFGAIAVYDSVQDVTLIYLHSASALAKVGDVVKLGDAIGAQGDRGAPGAMHVHVEARRGRQVTGTDQGKPQTLDPIAVISGYLQAAVPTSPQPAPPAVGVLDLLPRDLQAGQNVRIAVQTAAVAKAVRVVFDQLNGGATAPLTNPSGNGRDWELTRAITLAGDASKNYQRQVWAIAVDEAGREGAAKGPLTITVRPAAATPPPPVVPTPSMTSAQAQAALLVNQPAVILFQGQNLTADVRVTLANCDNVQTQLVNATQIRHQCTPRAAGVQAAGWKASAAEANVRAVGMLNVAAAPARPPPPPVASVTAVQAQSALVVNQPAVILFQGQNLTADVRVTLANCDNVQSKLVNATQIRHQCTPRAAGAQAAGWKASTAEANVRTVGMLTVAAAPVQPQPQPSPSPGPIEMQPAQGCATGGVKMCGVDGRTYPNACTLLKSGVAKRSNGPC